MKTWPRAHLAKQLRALALPVFQLGGEPALLLLQVLQQPQAARSRVRVVGLQQLFRAAHQADCWPAGRRRLGSGCSFLFFLPDGGVGKFKYFRFAEEQLQAVLEVSALGVPHCFVVLNGLLRRHLRSTDLPGAALLLLMATAPPAFQWSAQCLRSQEAVEATLDSSYFSFMPGYKFTHLSAG